MPKVTLFIATSLDGYIASPDGTVDWLFHDADYGYTDFMASIDAVLLGRKTWQQALTFEEVPFAGKQVFVCSRAEPVSDDDRIRVLQGDPPAVLAEIRRHVPGNIWLVGGADLVRQFVAHNLIDEYRLFLHPLVLGAGIPLFLPQESLTELTFVSSTSFPSGLVELTYLRKGV